MKKNLLSILVACGVAFSASAQTLVPIYGGGEPNDYDSVNSATGFTDFAAGVGQTIPTDWAVTEETTAGNIDLHVEGTSDTYYVWGTNNGRYDALGANVSFGYTGAETGYLAFRVKAGNDKTRIKLSLQTTDGKTFAKETDLAAYSTTAFTDVNIPFADMRQEDGNGDPTTVPATYPTAADLANASQINIVLVVNSCQWDGAACVDVPVFGEFWVDDIHMSESLLSPVPVIAEGVISSNKSALENIASSKLYPNPVSDMVKVELNLKSSSEVKVTLTDLMGREVDAVEATTSVLNHSFNVSTLTKGLYTVNYFINGAPAKAELLMVK